MYIRIGLLLSRCQIACVVNDTVSHLDKRKQNNLPLEYRYSKREFFPLFCFFSFRSSLSAFSFFPFSVWVGVCECAFFIV